MADDIFRNKKDFARAEFTTEVSPPMRPYISPREAKSQKAQYESGGGPGLRKDVKIPIKYKTTSKRAHGQCMHNHEKHRSDRFE
ncbi:MAG: hypothetical protein PWR27_1872 [Petroclostridium sp.]|jgi:hypothetical protein|uniref:hypothetical protein n=1 Tax=Petroclostridium xylanilyticum TaxID=1792311 RepID=UPI000B99BB06|nr:hypothetical protein [Petroclostridium xylanilyticum]MBZ4644716.1 hypothetical protein [Clostridia bacterium]MDK2811163.1 hypothetical protein [Petroclostridium sp.]